LNIAELLSDIYIEKTNQNYVTRSSKINVQELVFLKDKYAL